MSSDPFAVLGIPARPDVTDDDVRAAWRRIAAATHPDQEDGGDPARFALAAAAYAALRTSYGRGEALADLRAAEGRSKRRRPFAFTFTGKRRLFVAFSLRLVAAAAVSALAVLAAGWSPGSVAVLTGALTFAGAAAWRVRTRR